MNFLKSVVYIYAPIHKYTCMCSCECVCAYILFMYCLKKFPARVIGSCLLMWHLEVPEIYLISWQVVLYTGSEYIQTG